MILNPIKQNTFPLTTRLFFSNVILNILINNYFKVRLMSIVGICISDLLQVDLDRSISWLQLTIEPYLFKLNELANLKADIDKHQQAVTCHLLNMLTQLMSSLTQRQRSHPEETFDSSIQSHLPNESLNQSTNQIKNSNHNEKKIVNSILIKLIPIYKMIIRRNLPTDLILIDVSLFLTI